VCPNCGHVINLASSICGQSLRNWELSKAVSGQDKLRSDVDHVPRKMPSGRVDTLGRNRKRATVDVSSCLPLCACMRDELAGNFRVVIGPTNRQVSFVPDSSRGRTVTPLRAMSNAPAFTTKAIAEPSATRGMPLPGPSRAEYSEDGCRAVSPHE